MPQHRLIGHGIIFVYPKRFYRRLCKRHRDVLAKYLFLSRCNPDLGQKYNGMGNGMALTDYQSSNNIVIVLNIRGRIKEPLTFVHFTNPDPTDFISTELEESGFPSMPIGKVLKDNEIRSSVSTCSTK